MFAFVKEAFIVTTRFFNLSYVDSLKCVPMNIQERKIRSEIINVNINEPMFYPYSIKINNCKGSCNTINDPYAKLCISDTIKNINKCQSI